VSIGGPAVADAPAAGLLQLRVAGGPDAGGLHPLRPGTLTLGRGPGARIRLDDPDMSREHARLTVTAGDVCVHDLGSTNGTSVDGRHVGAEPLTLSPGALLRAGESTLSLSGPDEAPAAVQADGAGHLAVNRPPRLLQAPPSVTVRLPAAPAERDKPKFPVLAMLIPLLIGAVMVRVMGSWTFALFMLLSPLMLGANVLSEKVGGRRAQRKARAAYERASAAAQATITAGLAEEAALRRVEFPDPAALLLTATGPRPRLWERRPADPDTLLLRLGTAELPARLTVRPPGADESPQHPPVPAVPLTVPLRAVGVLGLAGPRRRVEALARHVVAQLAGLHSPRDLSIVVLCSGDTGSQPWDWARWLPHLRPGAGQACDVLVGLTAEQVAVRVAELLVDLDVRAATGRPAAGEWAGPATLLFLDGARALRSVAGVARLLAEGPRVGIYAICLATDPLDLPAECGATATVTGAVGTRLQLRRTGHPPVDDAVADLVSLEWAERFARGLGPLRDATPDGSQAALPDSARLLDLLGLGEPAGPTAETIASRWLAGGRSTVALVGVAADGCFSVDLRRDGPHALVAGTTGAGKSELLQTLVASLATVNRPDELTFVLVDYKGGSAFADCSRLPHTVGMVTDLDRHLTARALASLEAELKRRERALRAGACKDLDDYLAAGSPGERLPRLVIVIDEFASLVQELPDFVTGLVDIARRGRSLGVHLVLATQRPAGVVSADIRANTNLRIALRVTDPAESQDIIESKAAALIGRATPGRACCRIGSGSVVTFQGARVAGLPPSAAGAPATVRPLAWERAGDAPPPAVSDLADAGPTDFAALVEAVRAAAVVAKVPAVRSPWLAPLPALIARGDLPIATPETLLLGLVDLPAEQAQAPFTLDLAGGGHLLAAGGPG
ncbi:MAG: FtsK/SpoIIIE domain-containing protein, partial [Actinomycetota bacterium]|nr:FtsK/SpoIIIE domain-containing protein [Actinomycetota bacterium]